MSTVGLTLGKYAPFHKGHEHVIRTALGEVDRLIVVVYDSPEVTGIPLNIRTGWIRSLYPQVEVIEGWGGPSDMGDTPEIRKKQEGFIHSVLQGQSVTHFYSSEFYGEHMSKALGAVNRQVDPARNSVPISGTEIRKNPFKYREYLSPIVYRDHVVNVVFVGAPSTGKTTLAEDCANCFNTVWMPEYGREYWERNHVDRRLTLEQLVEIAEGHLRREDELVQKAARFLFSDTNAITTYMFSLYYHRTAHERLAALAQQAEKRYDMVFLCDCDIPYDDTWDRSGDMHRLTFQRQIIADLKSRKIPCFTVSGTREQRVEYVGRILEGFEKYSNVLKISGSK